jgi:hypothetical protein
MSDDGPVTGANEQGVEFGPKLPPLENARDAITEVISKLADLQSGGIEFNRYASLQGGEELRLTLQVRENLDQQHLVITLNEPQPQVNLASWIKSKIPKIVVTPYKIQIELAGMPDLEVEVKS